jgi:hypothetical protein
MATDEVPKDVQPHVNTVRAGPGGAPTISHTQHDNHENLTTRKYNMERWLGQKPKDEPWNDVRNVADRDRQAK